MCCKGCGGDLPPGCTKRREYCKRDCWQEVHREELKQKTREWRAENIALAKEVERKAHVARVSRRHAKRVAALGPVPRGCEICGTSFTTTSARWDHNHGTGKDRGWLCNRCNAGIGFLGDNPSLIRRAAKYLDDRGYAASRPVIR